ncbi:MAG: hypothetical protein ACREFC_12195 [Stellaceae bacterium]
MSTLLGLAPFILFFVLMRLSTPMIALAGATLVSAILIARIALRGGSIKILEIGSLVLFGLLTLYTVAARPDWSIAGVRLAVDGGMTLIVLASLIVRRPFTLQYAKEQVPEQFWNNPIFLRTNDLITSVWFLAFLVSAACDAASLWAPAVPVVAEIVASVGAFLFAVWFSVWYPKRVRRNIPRPAGAAG